MPDIIPSATRGEQSPKSEEVACGDPRCPHTHRADPSDELLLDPDFRWKAAWVFAHHGERAINHVPGNEGAYWHLRWVVAEVEAFRALDLGDLDGRVSASCDNPEHPTWLRKPDDTRGCPWCRTAELELAVAEERGKTFREAARLLEATDRDDDAVNLLDLMASSEAEVR